MGRRFGVFIYTLARAASHCVVVSGTGINGESVENPLWSRLLETAAKIVPRELIGNRKSVEYYAPLLQTRFKAIRNLNQCIPG